MFGRHPSQTAGYLNVRAESRYRHVHDAGLAESESPLPQYLPRLYVKSVWAFGARRWTVVSLREVRFRRCPTRFPVARHINEDAIDSARLFVTVSHSYANSVSPHRFANHLYDAASRHGLVVPGEPRLLVGELLRKASSSTRRSRDACVLTTSATRARTSAAVGAPDATQLVPANDAITATATAGRVLFNSVRYCRVSNVGAPRRERSTYFAFRPPHAIERP